MIVADISVDFPIVDEPLAFDVANRAKIDADWAKRIADKPRMWNGPFFLFTGVTLGGSHLTAKAHPTDFATFLYHRHVDRGHEFDVMHITGTSLITTSDNVIIAMEMASHTANAGHIYFPAGSFDPDDVVDGRLDVFTNVVRELGEEVGLHLGAADFEDDWVGVRDDDTWHIAMPSRLDMTFDEFEKHFQKHQRDTGDDELARLFPVRNSEDSQALRPFARMLADHMLDKLKSA
ncbi:MAG: NUDIX hydrolase [Pseudomonadota bacterium]